jgi:hypothetical protein
MGRFLKRPIETVVIQRQDEPIEDLFQGIGMRKPGFYSAQQFAQRASASIVRTLREVLANDYINDFVNELLQTIILRAAANKRSEFLQARVEVGVLAVK